MNGNYALEKCEQFDLPYESIAAPYEVGNKL